MGAKLYPAYKDSGVEWIGEIPEHWEVKPNSSFMRLVSNKVGGQSSQFPVLSLTQRGVIVRDLDSNDGKYPASFDGYQLVATDNLVFCLFDIDETPRTVGLVKQSAGIITNAYTAITLDKRVVDPSFVEKYYIAIDDAKRLKPFYTGLRKVVQKSRFFSIRIQLPPLEEQKQIASFLDRETSKIDTLIEKKQQLINLLKEKRGSLISHTVTKGLNPNVPMKDSGVEWIGEIPEHWEVKGLGRSCVVSPKRNKSLLSNLEQLVSFLPMTAFNNDGTADYSSEVVLESVISGYTYMEFGDIAISKVTPCFENGKAARLKNMPTKVGFGTTEVTVIRPLRLFGDYVFYIFRVPEVVDLGVSWMYGVGGLQRIPDSFFEQLVTPFPPQEEQKQIASYLDAETSKIDTLIGKANQSIALLKERRSSLISAAVTGKIDVRGVA